jgi:RNA polymerase sigma-70 factor (ECF subfamily)
MDRDTLDERLSRIATLWTKLRQAHGGSLDEAARAQAELLQRYGGAVYRYLLGAVRDPDVAEELTQEFALRFLRGDFRRADPGRGRFRDYLKVALRHLVTDHHRARAALPRQLSAEGPEPVAPNTDDDTNRDFTATWRQELLEQTWKALARHKPAYHAVLRFRVENPEATSAEAAGRLSVLLGKQVTGDWVRKTQQRAQAKFAGLLIDEVARSLGTDAAEVLKGELRELDLLRYCRSALAERRPGTPSAGPRNTSGRDQAPERPA